MTELMNKYLFANFRLDKAVYKEALTFWNGLLQQSAGNASVSGWSVATGDHDPRDRPEDRGNPVLFATCPSQRRAIQVIQRQPNEFIGRIHVELGDFGDPEWEDHARNLRIICVLHKDMLPAIKSLLALFVDGRNDESIIQQTIDEVNAADDERLEVSRARALELPVTYLFPAFDRDYADYVAARNWWLSLFTEVLESTPDAECWIVNTFLCGGLDVSKYRGDGLLRASTGDTWQRRLTVHQIPPGYIPHEFIIETLSTAAGPRTHQFSISISCMLTAESALKVKRLLKLIVDPKVTNDEIEACVAELNTPPDEW